MFGFTALVNELRNANRNDFCLSEAGLSVAASGVHGSGHVCHPQAVVQPSAGVRGSLCLQEEEGLQLEERLQGRQGGIASAPLTGLGQHPGRAAGLAGL